MAGHPHISLLGGFTVTVDGAQVPESSWRLRKSRSVLKVLALAPQRSLNPERLQGLLWPDREPGAASNNLRQAVYHARRALTGAGADGGAVLELRGDLLTLDAAVDVDVDVFERAAARAESTGSEADIEAALALYGGELLPEDTYEDWAAEPRRVLADRHVRLLLALAATRDPAGATEPLHRAIVADPLNEEAHRALMRSYASSGRRAQALAQYEILRGTLQSELAADPEADTRALYRQLLAEGAPEVMDGAARTDHARAADVVTPVAAARHNLPWQPTSFVGRRRELEEIDRTIESRRLVTLTGPGGCGKTRLALEIAQRRLERHLDGAWVIELAGVADSALVGQATAAALGLDLSPDEPPEQSLARHLSGRELLLLLDNCEHLLEACARLAETVLAQCPGVTILATSREPLHLPGEVDWRVPSMAMVDTTSLSDVGELAAVDAVELFCDRARAANPRFELSVANAQAVAEICLRVDGLPLAIELAAARTTALSPAEIARRLEDGLAVLRAKRASGLTRQQTLEATLDWSHDMLGEKERVLFRRLSVFAGGCELEAVEQVTSGEGMPEADVLEILASLVDKSLVGVDDAEGSYRYRLLEPVRQYAAGRLAEAGEAAALVGSHAEWFAAVTDQPGGRVTDVDPRWVARLERDHDNLRAAMSWLLGHRPGRALEMAAGMAGLWLLRAHLREGCRWLDRALAAHAEPDVARAAAMHARQALERRRPLNYDVADQLTEDGIAIYRALGDRRDECLAVLDLADGALLRGRLGQAIALAGEAGEIAAALGEEGLRAAALERIGVAAAWRHDFDAAWPAFDEALAICECELDDAAPSSAVVSLSGFIADTGSAGAYPVLRLEETSLQFRRLRPRVARASLRSHRAYLLRCSGRYDESRAELDAALAIVRESGSPLDDARLVAQRGALEIRAADLEAANDWLGRSLELRQRLHEHRGILLSLASLAVVASLRGEHDRSTELLARAARMGEEAVDGPGMGAVLLAEAEIRRTSGEPELARQALDGALTVFYDVTGLIHYASWLHLQHAYLSADVGDDAEAARRIELAAAGFTESRTQLGLDHCEALTGRLRAAN